MNNQLAGVWRLRHMTLPPEQDNTYGAAPDGLLTLTEDLHQRLQADRSPAGLPGCRGG